MTPAGPGTTCLRGFVRTVWSAGDLSQLPRFVHPDVVVSTNSHGDRVCGLPALADLIRQARAPFDHYEMTIVEAVEQHRVVATRWTVRARLRDPALLGDGLRALAGELTDLLWLGFAGMSFTTFQDGRIVRERTESNPATVAQQLGTPG
ncbi:ester cyclase [Solwaraspora sp. WMMD791]|uniref:ester cyclase n=1 Tax=Solwaraspora sp. WMMD791 TaxID=3016086 RepID=UPI00249C9A19|nr:nuclear transport factor 2 family protein [Solwaraspora sp. WMMD791]WFE28377.1 ester cyclase [Solwaraspora sp. WMMD791]